MSDNEFRKITAAEKLSLFACLYFAQGLPYGFFTQAMPVYLREAKASLAAIGGAALLTWPWALKFLWAPLADRYGFRGFGLRRSWIVPLQFISILALVIVSFLNPGDSLIVVLVAFLICNLVAATQDAATDGLAVDLLRDSEKGWGNGIQVGGYRIGMIAGGSVMLTLLSTLGWQAAMLAMATTLFLVSLPVLFFRENEVLGRDRVVRERAPLRPFIDFGTFLKQPGILGWFVILLVYKFSHQGASAMIKPWLVDNGYPLEEIGALMGLFGSGAGLVGAVLGAWVASRFDRTRSLILLSFAQAAATTTYLIPVMGSSAMWKVALATTLDNGVSGIATVTLFAAMMDRCRREHAAADYSIQASVVVVSQTFASAVSGVSAEYLGYGRHFLGIAGASLLIACSVLIVLKRRVVTSRIAGLILPALFAFSATSVPLRAGAEQNEFGIGVGPLLPSRISRVREIVNGWGLRYGSETRFGFFELEWLHGRGDDIIYNAFNLDYRMDLLDTSKAKGIFPAHFVLGFQGDYYKPATFDEFRQSGGWHYGGGIRLPLGGTDSPVLFRADFKHRFSPGTSLIVLVGFSFLTGGETP